MKSKGSVVSLSTFVGDLAAGAPDGSAGAKKHASILAAARRLFLQSGYAGVSMDQVADSAGVAKQTVYRHFATKDALFAAMVADMGARFDAALEAPPKPQASPRQALAALATRYARLMLDPEVVALLRVVAAEAERFPELGRTLWDAGPARAQRQVAAYLAGLAAEGGWAVGDEDAAAGQLLALAVPPCHMAMLLGQAPPLADADLERWVDAAVARFAAGCGDVSN